MPVPSRSSAHRPVKESGGIDSHRALLSAVHTRKIHFHAFGRGHYPGKRLARGDLPGLLSVGSWDARGDQDWGLELHRNEGIEICFLETGLITFAVANDVYPLRPGDFTITRPWEMHRQGTPHIAASRLHWVTIDVDAQQAAQPWRWPDWIILQRKDVQELTRYLSRKKLPPVAGGMEIAQSFKQLARAVAAEQKASQLSLIAVAINRVLLAALDSLRAGADGRAPRLRADAEHTVREFLNSLRSEGATPEEGWSLKAMAKACGMGTTQFSAWCRRLTNESPKRYLSTVRLESAAQRLRSDPERPVTDVAFDCGFNSSHYFAHQFHRRYGCTPTAWRQSRQGRSPFSFRRQTSARIKPHSNSRR